MKISVAFMGKQIGFGTSTGDEVQWEGNVPELKRIAAHWERQGLKGEALLQKMLERLRGHMWAQEVPEN